MHYPKLWRRNTRGCGYERRNNDAEEEWQKERRDRRVTEWGGRARCLPCRKSWRETVCRKLLRLPEAKGSCWNGKNWTTSTTRCKHLVASRPTHQNPKSKK